MIKRRNAVVAVALKNKRNILFTTKASCIYLRPSGPGGYGSLQLSITSSFKKKYETRYRNS